MDQSPTNQNTTKTRISRASITVMAADNLTHEQVWDDSALLDSWDAAVAEYKVSPLFNLSPHLSN